MWDSSSTEGAGSLRGTLLRWLPLLLIILLSLALVGCFFWHPELTARGLAIVPHQTVATTPAADSAAAQEDAETTAAAGATEASGGQGTASGASTGGGGTTTVPDGQATGAGAAAGTVTSAGPNEELDLLIGQLQTMQGSLAIMTQELDRRYPAGSSPADPAAMDQVAVLAEMERLNQVMQPLMAQIEAARQSGRAPAEVAAMQTQMSEIHHRLVELMAAVEAARVSNRSGQ
jgi:hypothetical protein